MTLSDDEMTTVGGPITAAGDVSWWLPCGMCAESYDWSDVDHTHVCAVVPVRLVGLLDSFLMPWQKRLIDAMFEVDPVSGCLVSRRVYVL